MNKTSKKVRNNKNVKNKNTKVGNFGFVKKLMKSFKIAEKEIKPAESTNKVYSPDEHGFILLLDKPGKVKKTGDSIITDSIWEEQNKQKRMLPICKGEQEYEESMINNKPNKEVIKLPRLEPYHEIKDKVYPKLGFFPIGHKKDKNYKNLGLPKTEKRMKCWLKKSTQSPWIYGKRGKLGEPCINTTHCNEGLVCNRNLGGLRKGICETKILKTAQGTYKNGEPCFKDINCQSKKCLKNITGIGKGKCIAMNIEEGGKCNYDYQCVNKNCSGNRMGMGKGTCKKMKILSGKNNKKGTYKKGERCRANNQCLSGKCSSTSGFVSGKCI